jgi:hypothetical protein
MGIYQQWVTELEHRIIDRNRQIRRVLLLIDVRTWRERQRPSEKKGRG